MKVAEFVAKRCFYTKKDGTTGVLWHKSVILDDGTTIRWNRKSQNWKIVGPERLDTAVATSLSRYAMTVAIQNGKMRSDVEEFSLMSHFLKRLAKLVGEVDECTTIVAFLGGA